MSTFPVRLFAPPPIRPIDSGGNPRKDASLSRHWSMSCLLWTSTRVFTLRAAIIQEATTVLPKAVPAWSTPSSWASSTSAASFCCGLREP